MGSWKQEAASRWIFATQSDTGWWRTLGWAVSSIHLILTDSSSLWPIRGQYPGHVNSINQSEACVQVTWPVVTNHNLSSAEWNSILKISKDVKLVTSSKSELESIWYLLNSAHQDSGRACVQHPTPIVVTQKGQRSLTHFIPAWSCVYWPIRGQYQDPVNCSDQSEAGIFVTWVVLGASIQLSTAFNTEIELRNSSKMNVRHGIFCIFPKCFV